MLHASDVLAARAPVGRAHRSPPLPWRQRIGILLLAALAAGTACKLGESGPRARLTVGTYWGGAASEALRRELTGIATELEAVDIEVRSFTVSGLNEYLFESQPNSSEDTLDLVVVPNDWLGRLWQRRVIGEIPSARVQRLQQSLVRRAMLTVSDQDEVLGLPIAAEVLALVYDPQRFPSPPRSIDDIVAVGAREHVLPLALNLASPYDLAPFVSSYQGLLVDRSGGLAWRDDVLVHALDRLRPAWSSADGWRACRGPDLESLQIQLFIEGKLASFLTGPATLSVLEASHRPFAVLPVPAFTDSTHDARPLVGYQCVAVARGSAWIDLALDVAERLCRRDVNERLNRETRRLPVLLASYKTATAMASPGMVGFLQALEGGQLFPSDYRWSDGFQRVAEQLQRLTAAAQPPTQTDVAALLHGGGP